MATTAELINATNAAKIIQALIPATKGPAEAYGTLCLAIWLLNFEFCDNAVSIDELCEEVVGSLRSIKAQRERHDA